MTIPFSKCRHFSGRLGRSRRSGRRESGQFGRGYGQVSYLENITREMIELYFKLDGSVS